MKISTLSILALAGDAVQGLTRRSTGSEGLTVETSSGSFIGMIDPEYPHTRQFRSIPFAEPPVGSYRWLPPQKLSEAKVPDRPRYSTKFPPSCPQFVSSVPTMWNMNLTEGNLIYNGAQNDTSGLVGEATSEDCLHLAIWAPTEIPEEGLPVLFFMTGGGWVIGGVDLPWQIPTTWVERSKEHIVVTINYRLNIFGFPNARGLKDDEQNLGIMDQRFALEWVRDNIAAFGGDPERIMQWGRSAGAVATDIHSFAYLEDPIAQSYYVESASAVELWHSTANFSWVAENVGCGKPCGGVECADEEEYALAEIDCMRQVSFLEITNFIGDRTDRGEIPYVYFSPVLDHKLVFEDYKEQADAGLIAHRPFMLSFTSHEFSSLAPWPAENVTEGPWMPPVIDLSIDFGVCPARNFTEYRNNLGPGVAPVYRFQYAAEFPNLNVYDWLGAYHNSETPIIFGAYHLLDFIAPSTEYQREVSESLQDHILAFAKDPWNGPQTLGWEPMVTSEENGGSMLRFGGKSGKVVQAIDGHEVDGVCLGIGEYDAYP